MLSRRGLLLSVATWIALSARSSGAQSAASEGTEATEAAPAGPERRLIVNADDLGLSEAVDEGILEAHTRGIVTSASLLVDGAHAGAAVRAAAAHPDLGLGLHADFGRGHGWASRVENLAAMRTSLERQLATFVTRVGRLPDHINGHHHVHMALNVARIFLEVGSRHGIPVRGLCAATFVGSFWGLWPPGPAGREHIGTGFLIGLLGRLGPGVSELGCHPGHRDPGASEAYNDERAIELATLTDPSVRRALTGEGIRLVTYGAERAVALLVSPSTAGARPAGAGRHFDRAVTDPRGRRPASPRPR